jgi:hypothetical protein
VPPPAFLTAEMLGNDSLGGSQIPKVGLGLGCCTGVDSAGWAAGVSGMLSSFLFAIICLGGLPTHFGGCIGFALAGTSCEEHHCAGRHQPIVKENTR